MILAFQRRFTFLGLLGAMFLVPLALTLLNFALNRLLRNELEPMNCLPLRGTRRVKRPAI